MRPNRFNHVVGRRNRDLRFCWHDQRTASPYPPRPCPQHGPLLCAGHRAGSFRGVALTRNWGRIGTKGRFRIELFGSRHEAEQRFVALARSKVRRGYRQLAAAS
uniref:WGR domain-containing protein n=1 Tax=Neorhizobium sp. EC2-8 TaxID=3129230 RepID=UPI0031016A05